MRFICHYPIKINVFLIAFIIPVATLYAEQSENNKQPEASSGQHQGRPMSNERLGQLIKRIDSKVNGRPGFWRFSVEGQNITVITDERANRMRIISPITKTNELDESRLYRLMQSNFDSTLDARYSIAKDTLWSAFIHPLGSLEDEEFLSALGQVVNLVQSYGKTYSSGALIFHGGDSEGINRRKLIDDLIQRGMAI